MSLLLNQFIPFQRTPSAHRRSVDAFRLLRPLGRIRYQLLGGALFGVVLPAVLRFGIEVRLTAGGSLGNSVVGTFLAMVLGYYFLRRLTGFPGTSRVPYVFIAFLVSYGLAMALFFFFRW